MDKKISCNDENAIQQNIFLNQKYHAEILFTLFFNTTCSYFFILFLPRIQGDLIQAHFNFSHCDKILWYVQYAQHMSFPSPSTHRHTSKPDKT